LGMTHRPHKTSPTGTVNKHFGEWISLKKNTALFSYPVTF
jgi:hypothetical protein